MGLCSRDGSSSRHFEVYFLNLGRTSVERLKLNLVKTLSLSLSLCLFTLSFLFPKKYSFSGWLAVVLTIFMMVLLILEIWGPAFVFMIVQTLVLLIYYTWDVDYAVCSSCTLDTDSDTDLPMCEEITTSRAVAGFSNSGVLTGFFLFSLLFLLPLHSSMY